jgi:hypothetical protein
MELCEYLFELRRINTETDIAYLSSQLNLEGLSGLTQNKVALVNKKIRNFSKTLHYYKIRKQRVLSELSVLLCEDVVACITQYF